MRKLSGNKPKLTSCTPEDVFGALRKLGGFEIVYDGAKHTKVRHVPTGKASTIPRTSPINKHLLRDFVEKFLVESCGIEEEEVYKHLWC